MNERREWIPLSEAFDRIADMAAVKAEAEKRQPNLPDGWDIADAINLVTEEAMSEAGRRGKLRFRGLKTEYARKRFPVPTTWFEARAGKKVTAPRGVDTAADELWFTPLHQVQNKDFVGAADFEVKERADVPRWYDVIVQTETLVTFLGGAVLPPRPPNKKVIDDTIAAVSQNGDPVTLRTVTEKLKKQGFALPRRAVERAIKDAGFSRKRGRPASR